MTISSSSERIEREKLETVDDDLTGETFFYERALESANQVVKKLKKLGVPVKRPHDYYAEMVKSDEHMKKVRSELMYEQQQLEIRDERRKTREAKRYGKQVQAEKVKQRTLAKKAAIKDLDKWRLQRKKSGFCRRRKAPFDVSGGDAKRKRKPETLSLVLAARRGCVILFCSSFFERRHLVFRFVFLFSFRRI